MLVRENGVHSLIIEPVLSRDAGIYTCIATNRAGQNSFSLELVVAGRLSLDLPLSQRGGFRKVNSFCLIGQHNICQTAHENI